MEKIKETEMLKMSFYDGTLDREVALKKIEETKKPLSYRYGFSYRGASLSNITKENAIEIIQKEYLLDITEHEDQIILNAYSSNDMF